MIPLYKGKVRMLPPGFDCVQQIPGDWVIARVIPNHEKTVVRALHAEGHRFFFPYETVRHFYEKRSLVVKRPIMPGYVFVQQAAKELLNHDIFARHMGARAHRYKHVSPDDRSEFVRDLANLQIMADAAERDPDAPLNAIFHPLRERGKRVQVITGDYTGLDGEVVGWDGDNACVQVGVILLGQVCVRLIPEEFLIEV